ncbi:dual specificity protein kinase splA isoform X1 [Drosophila nasuta]|uniref:dual specificity protein kinase splA isoform X1 n=1 Tax=Drosophila nasuta TaxID=42062 RepID=UPI00295F3E78|nr:dual specificity protein kinase splA isoform X1 [Drosophila nasuta]
MHNPQRSRSHSNCWWLLPLAFVAFLLPHVVYGANHSSVIADAELSASERNRRLIPYMAFYLPAPELPINQQYAVKHAPSAGGAQLRPPLAAPSRIPVPVAYMPQPQPQPQPPPHHPHPHQHQHSHAHHQGSSAHYQQGAADIYHALQQHQGLAPGHGKDAALPADAGATFIAYKPLNPTTAHKHKTVQHFPPLSQHEQQQQQQQQQEQFELLPPPAAPQAQYHRQRGKQSKVNLTPFTAQNTLPGHFMPIIYTPVSKPSHNNNNNNELHNGNTINYNKKPASSSTPTEIVYHKNAHQTQIVTDYAPGDGAASSAEQQQQQEERGQEEVLVHPTPSVGYKVYSEPSSGSSSSTSSSKTALILHQKSQQSPGYGHVNKYESYFHMSPDQQQQSLTPQEKYVLYLQQRMKLQRQQQKQQQQQAERYHHQEDAHLQSAQSNTNAGKHQQQQHHNHPLVSSPQPPPQQPPQQPPQSPTQQHHSQLHNYNGLFGQQQQQQQQQLQTPPQQVLHIPLRALMGHLNHHNTHEQPDYAKEPLLGSPSPAQFIDYLIDGPRQSLDEEQQQHQQHQQQHHHQESSPSRAPQHAFILVTTPAPYADHPQAPRIHDLTPTRAPVVYKHQPTLRLQPVTPVHNYKATRRPVYITPPTPSETVKITPKYVYVSSKPPSASVPSELPSRSPPIKLKPVYKYAQERPTSAPLPSKVYAQEDADQLPDIRTSSLAEILHKLQASNHLPHTLTPDNIDNSIKTLIRILQNLKQTQTIVANPPQHHETKPSSSSNDHDFDYNTEHTEEEHPPTTVAGNAEADLQHLNKPNKHPGPTTGRAGIDYPNYSEIPKTDFECTQQRYKGFFGDPETNCQVWHYCDLNGGKASFLCPNGTIFSQIALTCDWWFNVKCSTTSQLYVLNERLYKYILPFNPKFPEDYNGPIVDKYLAMKFQEMEEKMRLEKQRKIKQQAEKPEAREEASTPSLPKNHKASPKHGSGINAQVYEQSSERNLLIDDEIDDISERGTYDTYGQAPTTIMAPTTTSLESQTLGRKPIVVSSTPYPEREEEPELTADSELEGEPPANSESSEEEDKLQSLRDTNAVAGQKRLETTKVSVEKLEVIEIKPDGNTGHLMPISGMSESSEQQSEQESSSRESKE